MVRRVMTYSLRFSAPLLLASSTLALMVACSASGDGDLLSATTDEAGATEPAPGPGSALPAEGEHDAGKPHDAGKDAAKDASKDAAKDSSTDAGKPAPEAGDACKTLDEVFTRSCGICGTQSSLCLAKDDGTPGVVSVYSPCANELASGCAPGTTETEACGNCGTRQRTCNQYCAWTTAACAGEPVSSCTPTAVDYTNAGCPTAGTGHTRSCNATCTWTNFTATCDPLDFKLVVAATPGDTVSAVYPLRATFAAKRLTGTCPNGTFSSTTNHPYVYVELVNPTENALTVSAWNTAATSGGTVIDTLMSWYSGNTRPTDDASRKTCAKGAVDSCPADLPCGDSKWAGLTGANAITLPAFGSALVFVGSYYPMGGSSASEGPVKLVVRTEPSL
jgi:hypothetical protein